VSISQRGNTFGGGMNCLVAKYHAGIS